MSEIRYRCELHNEDQARDVLTRGAHPWIKEQLKQGRELVAEFRLLDDDVTEKQRGYFHDVVLKEIALFAPGTKYHWRVWKEHFRSEYLGFKTVTSVNPITGKKTRKRVRISTEDLGVRGYAQHIERVIAFASTDLGVTVSEPLPPELRGRRKARTAEHIDQTTGEISEVAA